MSNHPVPQPPPLARAPWLEQICYGGDYYPEQWPEELWAEDARLMREAGVNLVSLGVFAWALLEPEPGRYEFGWLDRAMDLLHAHGVQVNLATATASPPPWLARLHPASLPVTRQGLTLVPGARQQYCPSSRAYRQAAEELTRRIAERYRDHPALALWHINNEYGCHVSECYCDQSAADFRAWLQRRYGSLDALNAAWGTTFWSQRYGDWAEIRPGPVEGFLNPTQQLDWRRFSSDMLLECFELERAVLRAVTPAIPLTTNFLSFWKPVNYQTWTPREDVVSLDSYPDPGDPAAAVEGAMAYDLTRSLGGGAPWILMEQTASQVQWRPRNPLKRPGQMRLWSHQALARGASGVMFFQWRASASGAEKFHGAMVPHVGVERSRVWREVAELGQELRLLAALAPARVAAEAAILLDWESWWALEIDGKPSAGLQLIDMLRRCYAPLFARNITADIVHPGADLGGYRLVVVPALYLVHDDLGPRLEQFAAAGGTVLVTFFSAIADQHDHIRLGGYPAPLRKLLGLRVEEFDPYPEGRTNRALVGKTSFGCDLWSDLIDLEGAEALASYGEDFYAGRPAVTRHAFGRGAAYYLGTRLDAPGMNWLLGQVCAAAGLRAPLAVPAGVEVVRRGADGRAHLFLLNHNSRPAAISLPAPRRDLLTRRTVAGELTLPAYGVAVLVEA